MSRAVILCRGEHESNLRGILQSSRGSSDHLMGGQQDILSQKKKKKKTSTSGQKKMISSLLAVQSKERVKMLILILGS